MGNIYQQKMKSTLYCSENEDGILQRTVFHSRNWIKIKKHEREMKKKTAMEQKGNLPTEVFFFLTTPFTTLSGTVWFQISARLI